jgi:hypothetical protein
MHTGCRETGRSRAYGFDADEGNGSTGSHPDLWVPDTMSPAIAECRKTRHGGRNPRYRACVETPRTDADRSIARETWNSLSATVGA